MTPERLKQGMFNLKTRRFGTIAEVMIRRLCNLGRSKNQFHDLYDDMAQLRVEVKFSTVRKTNRRKITEITVLNCIDDELAENREINFVDWTSSKFDCNIQQIKRKKFDVLYYGLFFNDKIVIFKIESEEIKIDKDIHEIKKQIHYSDKMHLGNEGEGQFHLNPKTLQMHLDNYLYQMLTYKQLFRLLS
jgi:hypothetical protein